MSKAVHDGSLLTDIDLTMVAQNGSLGGKGISVWTSANLGSPPATTKTTSGTFQSVSFKYKFSLGRLVNGIARFNF
jgi:hypothetical protein